jgi:hypothetical protein
MTEPEIEELGTEEEIIEDYKDIPPEKRYRCSICTYKYPKSYRQTHLCINCHTKHCLELVDFTQAEAMEIDAIELPNISYEYFD